MPDTHKPLRDDIQMLGHMLGDVIRTAAGETVFECIESIRASTKGIRGEDAGQLADVQDLLRELPIEEAREVTRGFGLFLTLANVAEQHHRLRRRRAHECSGDAAQAGSLDDTLDQLLAAGVESSTLVDQLHGQRVELVLTAHPTEITRSTVIQKLNAISELLRENDRPDLVPFEHERVVARLQAEITALWFTDEIRRDRPTPLDEARAGLFWFEQTLWNAAAQTLRRLDRSCRRRLGAGLPWEVAPIRFGTWMGGDRDGNPNVTAEIARSGLWPRSCLSIGATRPCAIASARCASPTVPSSTSWPRGSRRPGATGCGATAAKPPSPMPILRSGSMNFATRWSWFVSPSSRVAPMPWPTNGCSTSSDGPPSSVSRSRAWICARTPPSTRPSPTR
jgi:phosphoenolpyruvate carboxylase